MSSQQHQQEASGIRVGFAVVTLSDTRTPETDSSGALIRERMSAQGHTLIAQRIIRDEPAELNAVLDEWLANGSIDVIISNGGTGLSRRDQTIDTIEKRLERTIPGFGELFRFLSYKEIGSAAMLSRAVAGTIGAKLLFCLPGSTAAVRLAMDKLILGQVKHLVREMRK